MTLNVHAIFFLCLCLSLFLRFHQLIRFYNVMTKRNSFKFEVNTNSCMCCVVHESRAPVKCDLGECIFDGQAQNQTHWMCFSLA